MYIFTKEHHFLETESHKFASQYLVRKARYEQFLCPTEDEKQSFLLKYK